MITEKFKNLFYFARKSKIKAGDGVTKGNFPFYTSSSVLSKYFDIAEYYDESLILGTGGSASVHFANEPFSTSTDCIVAPTKTEKINTKFVYYYLLGNPHVLERGFKGAGLKHISKTYIQEIDIPIFPIETQNKIVDILDKASVLVKKREQAIKLLDDLLKFQFLEIFGDPIRSGRFKLTTLSTYIDKIQIGPFGSQLHKFDYISNSIPLINPVNIIDSRIQPNIEVTISKSKYSSLPNYHLKKGDIIMARRGRMGRCGIITEKEDGWFCGTGSLYIRPNNIKQSSFLLFCLTNSGTIAYLNHYAKGMIMKSLNKSIVANIPIIHCSKKIQIKFGKIYSENERIRIKMADSYSCAQNFFNSTLQKVFNGELNFNIDFELDALVREIDTEKKENDLTKISRNIVYLQRLVDKLNTEEFKEKAMYDKAKHGLFQLLREGTNVAQEYNKKNNSVKLVVK